MQQTEKINKDPLKIGDYAPNFSLPDQDGHIHRLSDYISNNQTSNKKNKILIYFYPKDDTPGCTLEGCNFRDNKKSFDDMGLIVFGVSKDNIKSHKKFHDKYNFNFTLLSDESADMIKEYDAWKPKKFMGKEFFGTVRKSILIDEQGKILKIYENVNTQIHANQVRTDISEI